MNTTLVILALIWCIFLILAASKSKGVAALYVVASIVAGVFYLAGTRPSSEVKDVKTSVVSTATSAAGVVESGWNNITSD